MADKAVSALTPVVNHAAIGNCFMVSQKGAGVDSTNSSLISALQIPYASLVNAYAGGSNAYGVRTVSSDRITPALQTIHDMWYDVYSRTWTTTDSTVHVINQSTNTFIKAPAMYVKQAGAWTRITQAWIKDAGTWKQILNFVPDVTTFIEEVGGGGGSGGTYCNQPPGYVNMCACSYGGGSAGGSIITATMASATVLTVTVGGAGAAGASVQATGPGTAGSGTAGGTSSVTGGGIAMYAYGGGGGAGGRVTCNARECIAGGCCGGAGSASGGNVNYIGSSGGCYAGPGNPGYVISNYGKGGATCGGAGIQGVVRITVPTGTSITTTGAVSMATSGSNSVYTFIGSGTMRFN